MSIQRYKQQWAQDRQAGAQDPMISDSSFAQDEANTAQAMAMMNERVKQNQADMQDAADQQIRDYQMSQEMQSEEPTAMPMQESGGSGVDYSGSVSGGGTKGYEGYRGSVYTDTTGNATVGYGHKLTEAEKRSGIYANGITREQGEALYQRDMAKHTNQLYAREPWIADLSPSQQTALKDMAFNMGPAFLDKFGGAKRALKEGNFSAAASSFANSKYAKQTGKRAHDNARRLMA